MLTLIGIVSSLSHPPPYAPLVVLFCGFFGYLFLFPFFFTVFSVFCGLLFHLLYMVYPYGGNCVVLVIFSVFVSAAPLNRLLVLVIVACLSFE
jgi:hypothetical protein